MVICLSNIVLWDWDNICYKFLYTEMRLELINIQYITLIINISWKNLTTAETDRSIIFLKFKSVAYNSQETHTGQPDGQCD